MYTCAGTSTVGFRKFVFLILFQTLGLLNPACTHFMRTYDGLTMVEHTGLCIWIWDLRPSTLNSAN